MASAMNSHVLPQLTAGNFNNWKFRVIAILEEKQIMEVLTENLPDLNETQKKAFVVKDAKARSTIIQCISDKYLDIVKDAKTAQEMMVALEGIFERKSVFTKLTLRRKLLTLKHKTGQKLDEHFLKFDAIIRELESLGSKVDETDKICYLLLSLNDEYDTVITAIETTNVDIKMDFVKAKLLDQELKMQSKGSQRNGPEETSFKACEIICYKCRQKGHKSFECKTKNSEQFYKNISRGRGTYRGHRQYSNRYRGQEKANQAESEISFIALNCGMSNNLNLNVFVVDSGATQHLVSDKLEEHMSNIEELKHGISIYVANGEMMVAEKKGVVHGYCQGRRISIPALIVNGMKHNLLSVGQLTKNGNKVVFQDETVSIIGDDFEVKCGKVNNLYTVNIDFQEGAHYCKENDSSLWHRRLGHLNYGGLKILGLPFSKDKCTQCLEGKSTKRSFISQVSRTRNIGELIHSDISGPVKTESINGEKYFQVLIDDYSHFTVVKLLKSKDEAELNIIEFIQLIKTQHGNKTKRIRLDNGGEFTSYKFKSFCRYRGIRIEYTLPYNSQQNGTSERMNRTLMDKVRTKFAETKLPKYLWGVAMECSAYELNRCPTRANRNGLTPAQIWYRRRDLSKLKVFGSRAWMIKLPRENKLEPRAKSMTMVGYCGGGYRLWDDKENKIVNSTNVSFDEAKTEYKEEKIDADVENKKEYSEEEFEIEENEEEKEEHESSSTEEENSTEELLKISKSGRVISQPKHLEDYEIYSAYCLLVNEEIPSTYSEAIHCKEWKQAINNELESHEKLNTWTTEDSTTEKKAIDTRWVFQIKEDGTKKARLVAKGFQLEEEDILNSMYSPVARMATVRMILSLAMNKNWMIKQMDIPTAFLNGTLEHDIYIKIPEGVKEEKGKILRLNRALYGLKEAPKCWNNKINEVLVTNGLRRSQYDFCLYIGENVWLVIFVDDIIITGEKESIEVVARLLEKEFKAKDLGEVSNFLGMNITINGDEMKITQERYIQKLLKTFNMIECKGVSTPMEVGFQVNTEIQETREVPFRRLVGSLMYLAATSRPDIMFAVAYISRWCDKPTSEIWSAGKRILRYLKSTASMGLIYRKGDDELISYSDADWAGDRRDRKSVSGNIVMYGGNPVSWFSRKQSCVALSTAEAEYIAAATSAQELVYLKGIRSEFKGKCKSGAVLCVDNMSALSMMKCYENTKRAKHIDIKLHFVKDLITKNIIFIKYVCTQENIADLLTKALCKEKFVKCRIEANVE